MEQKMINAHSRTETGKSAARQLRLAGRIPAVMYDNKGKSEMVDISEKDFSKLFHSITESTLVAVKIEGKKDVVVFVKDVQYNILSNSITHVDFYEVESGKVLRTKIRIKFSGSPEGVRLGGVLEAGIPEIEVECLPKVLPERVIVDVSALQLNHSLHVRDIKLADGVKILTDPELAIATLKYAKTDTPAAAEESTAPAVTAAPAAKPGASPTGKEAAAAPAPAAKSAKAPAK
jgi:large subunit ribosomal protein L25